jgi:uncharacterized protein YciI
MFIVFYQYMPFFITLPKMDFMKSVLSLVFILFIGGASVNAQNKKPEEQIRKYWFVMLMRGADRSQDSITAAKLQAGHMANMDTMYYAGKLKVAGPFGDDGSWRGIFIFDCETREEVEQLLKKDPAIAAGRLSYEIKAWYTTPTGNFAPGKPARQ